MYMIPEGSKVQIFVNDNYQLTVRCPLDAEIENNSIAKVNGVLLCTNSTDCVKQVSENEYQIYTWLQDHIIVVDGELYDSSQKID